MPNILPLLRTYIQLYVIHFKFYNSNRKKTKTKNSSRRKSQVWRGSRRSRWVTLLKGSRTEQQHLWTNSTVLNVRAPLLENTQLRACGIETSAALISLSVNSVSTPAGVGSSFTATARWKSVAPNPDLRIPSNNPPQWLFFINIYKKNHKHTSQLAVSAVLFVDTDRAHALKLSHLALLFC